MDVKLAQKCSLKWRRLNDGRCWRDAGGHRLNIMGAAVVSFEIGPWTFEDEVVVVDGLVHQVLIGVDIMSPRRFVVDSGNKLLTIDGRSTSIEVPGVDRPAQIATDYTITLPARSEGRVYVRCPRGLGEEILVEDELKQTGRAAIDGLYAVGAHGVFAVKVVNRRVRPFVMEGVIPENPLRMGDLKKM